MSHPSNPLGKCVVTLCLSFRLSSNPVGPFWVSRTLCAPYLSGSVSEIPGHSRFLIYGSFSPLRSPEFYYASLATAEQLDKCFWINQPRRERMATIECQALSGPRERHVSGTSAVSTGLFSIRLCGSRSCSALFPLPSTTHFFPDPLLQHHPIGNFLLQFYRPFSSPITRVFSQSITTTTIIIIVNIYWALILFHEQF